MFHAGRPGVGIGVEVGVSRVGLVTGITVRVSFDGVFPTCLS